MSASLRGEDLSPEQVLAARNYFEMECLVRALDSMETIASSEAMAQEYVFFFPHSSRSVKYMEININSSPTEEVGREFWSHAGNQVKCIKSYMRPILNNWLLESLQGLCSRHSTES